MQTLTSDRTNPRWHPEPCLHLKAPHGWINDPCAPGYDASTGTYHLFYQWNPKSCDWGNITWGHFTSSDGLYWKHDDSGPALEPSETYDHEGIFTGCFYPTGPFGEKGLLTVIYSSVTKLPIHWTLPHSRNCEGLSLAVSSDGGKTWQKSESNPVLQGEPEHLDVVGFRDPYLASWLALDEIRGKKSLYGIVSGGILNKGPTVFVYAVSPDDLTQWEYLGLLVDIAAGSHPPGPWNSDFGVNWECTNFLTLHNRSEQCHFLITGTEGGIKLGPEGSGDSPHRVWTSWMAGTLKQTQDGPRLIHDFDGILDHGCLYAPNSYEHPESGRRIVWGWLKEEELTLARRETKGWTGYISLPRELFLFVAQNITRTLKTPLEDIPSLKVSGDQRKMVQTLGIRPLPELRTLRQSKALKWFNIGWGGDSGILLQRSPHSWELEAVIDIQPGQGPIGFFIRHNSDASLRTSVFFSPQQEKFIVDRSQSNQEEDIEKDEVSGSFTLFYSNHDGAEVLEKLCLHIFCDGDVIEIFVNDRFALSTMVYADVTTCQGISWFAEGRDEFASAPFESISIWENLAKIQKVEHEGGKLKL